MRDYQDYMPIDEVAKETIQTIVIDWLNKYPLEGDSQLSVINPEDHQHLKQWVSGVWGRITHQLADSGLPFSNADVLEVARKTLYEELQHHHWYEKVKPFLPLKDKKS